MKLAEEVEEREWDVGVDASSEDDHPSVVILNGLHLKEDQCVYLPFNVCIDIDWNCLGDDLQKTSKNWACTRHPSK
jgi:hypothetical protein